MDLDNFIIGKTKERRGEGRFDKKRNSYLGNIEQQLMTKIAKKKQRRGELLTSIILT